MSRGDGLARQLQLMQMLERRQEIVVPEVAAELGYTPRTVYRDLQVLERIGVPIYQERQGRKARWRVIDGYRRRLSITLSWPEMLALRAAAKMVEALGAPPLSGAAETALAKVGEALPPEVAGRAARLDEFLSAHPGALHQYAGKSEVLRTLIDALDRQESVRFGYRKPGDGAAAARTVDPYLLHEQSGALYLFGYCHRRKAIRTFLVDRITAAATTGAVFDARVPFAHAAMLQGAFGPWEGAPRRLRLRFDRGIAPIVAERRVHPSQAMQWRSDGALDLTLRAPICPPLIAWLLGWGTRVEIISPVALADRLRRAHARAASAGKRTSRASPRSAAPSAT